MTMTFVKILEYELYPTDPTVDVFGYVSGVLKQSINPPTASLKKLSLPPGALFCSPLLRARQCIPSELENKAIYIPELTEIPFDLAKFCSRDEWQSDKSVAVRKYFKEAFIQDKLLISRDQLKQEIRNIFEIGRKNTGSIFVSHTFRLVLIRAYHASKDEIFNDPNLIHQYILNNKKIMEFGEHFTIEADF